jgi:hypothetical protein
MSPDNYVDPAEIIAINSEMPKTQIRHNGGLAGLAVGTTLTGR